MMITGSGLLALAIPVLLFGEWLTRRIKFLNNSHIPPAVIGGLIAAVIVLVVNESGLTSIKIDSKVYEYWWTWLVTPEAEWTKSTLKGVNVYQPLLIAFFTCIGLNASWGVAKKGGLALIIYLVISTLFVFVQNGLGIVLAKLMGENPLLGLQCGGISLMGGFGTAAGFAPLLEQNGLQNAAVIGTAAAAFGVVAGSIIGGPTGRLLVERRVGRANTPAARLAAKTEVETVDHAHTRTTPVQHDEAALPGESEESADTFFGETASLLRRQGMLLVHLLILAISIKLGAWIYFGMTKAGLTFPVYIGAMLVGMTIRNIHDAAGWQFISSDFVDRIAGVSLAWLLSAVMISLQLTELVHTAGPMLVILVAQIIVMLLFVYFVVFKVMGRDYEAATMSVGMIGFGLGATSNAVATMKQMTRAYGPAPRAFMIVTVVGAFLIDLTNALVITGFINIFKPAAAVAAGH